MDLLCHLPRYPFRIDRVLALGDELRCPHCRLRHVVYRPHTEGTDATLTMRYFDCRRLRYFAGFVGAPSRHPTERRGRGSLRDIDPAVAAHIIRKQTAGRKRPGEGARWRVWDDCSWRTEVDAGWDSGRYTAGPNSVRSYVAPFGFHTMPSASSRSMRFRGSWRDRLSPR